jgi:hypothetical protein
MQFLKLGIDARAIGMGEATLQLLMMSLPYSGILLVWLLQMRIRSLLLIQTGLPA